MSNLKVKKTVAKVCHMACFVHCCHLKLFLVQFIGQIGFICI